MRLRYRGNEPYNRFVKSRIQKGYSLSAVLTAFGFAMFADIRHKDHLIRLKKGSEVKFSIRNNKK